VSSKTYPPAEFLFNLDGDRSLATIHENNRKQDTPSLLQKKSTVAFEVDDSSSSKSENEDSSSSSSLDGGDSNTAL